MQLLAEAGEEHGRHEGLGWIGGTVRLMEPTDPAIKVPHMGWNDVTPTVPHPLIDAGEAYFLHSYHFDEAGGRARHHRPWRPDRRGGGRTRSSACSFTRKRARPMAFPSVALSGGSRDTFHSRCSGEGGSPARTGSWPAQEQAPQHGLEMSIIVFPAIDLKGGQVVRLAEGDMDRATVYGDDPAAQALLFAEAGAQHLHVVDLDGSFRGESRECRRRWNISSRHFRAMCSWAAASATGRAVERWFDLGVARMVIGTAALKDPEFVKDMARDFPGGIVVAVDARDGFVATEGWADVGHAGDRSGPPVRGCRRRRLLFTDVGRDGMLKGCNVQATVDLARAVDIPVIASGGVAGIADIRVLQPARARRDRGRDYRAGAL
jgi:phosphoribosylformimino-5-aminoimidazole carboxamide ribotide isomerase